MAKVKDLKKESRQAFKCKSTSNWWNWKLSLGLARLRGYIRLRVNLKKRVDMQTWSINIKFRFHVIDTTVNDSKTRIPWRMRIQNCAPATFFSRHSRKALSTNSLHRDERRSRLEHVCTTTRRAMCIKISTFVVTFSEWSMRFLNSNIQRETLQSILYKVLFETERRHLSIFDKYFLSYKVCRTSIILVR